MSHPSAPNAALGAVHHFWTPLSPDEVRDALSEHPHLLLRLADDRTFSGTFLRPGVKNSWRPTVAGSLRPAAGGTWVQVRLKMHVLVVLFTVLHGIPFLGLTWLIGLGAYAWDLGYIRPLLQETTQSTHVGLDARRKVSEHEVSDPTQPGADANAPLALQARASERSVRFAVRGRRGTNVIEVGPRGLMLPNGAVLDWNDLETVDVVEEELAVLTSDRAMRVDLAGNTPADRLWLATYLDSRNRRWSETEAQRRLTKADRERLSGMRREA